MTQLASPWAVAGLTTAVGLLGYSLLKPKKPLIGECCPGQSAGFLPQDVNYACKGKMQDLKGVQAYVVGNKSSKAVVMVHDVFGVHSGRHKQLADEIAKRGFLVVVPDFFESTGGGLFGKEVPGFGMPLGMMLKFLWMLMSGKMKGFTSKHPWDPDCKRIWMQAVAPWLKEQGCTSAGLVSFCWGAYVAMHAAGVQPVVLPVTANVLFHPSFHGAAAHFKEDQEAIIKAAAKAPTAVYSTSMEPKSWQPGGQASLWMQDANPKGVVEWVQEKQMHGFMTRGDMKKDLQLAEDIQRCTEEAVAFLERHVA
eukprot:TRINITY_DN41302_c0_g1_i1.p1 TRINITY_DN41302_c0_g1~~TRINITY_DN41302_c0_g1_i1.p1  ORF type:complete len:309 (-),score=67.33 TRINITY_DN41302_c0_g1_i1:117-1043(-)